MECTVCGTRAKHRCAECETAYCGSKCQKVDWKHGHQNVCLGIFERWFGLSPQTVQNYADAIRNDEPETLEKIDARGDLLNQAFLGPTKQTPLIMAVSRSKKDVVEYLMLKGAKADVPSGDGSTIMHAVSSPDIFEQLQGYFGNNQLPLNVYNELGYTPLGVAVELGHPEIVKLLAQSGADPGKLQPREQNLLHLAVMNDRYEIAQYILSKRVEDEFGLRWTQMVTGRNSMGRTPLHLAAMEEMQDFVDLLTSKEEYLIPLWWKDKNGKRPYDYWPIRELLPPQRWTNK